ncbi:MAG: cupin domain-containing protein [Henriciella sp.]|uniref:cupin domain-containing protein n=1 Tax=Henriciella sp. TaxID=1968823 RepID=UPI003C74A72D
MTSQGTYQAFMLDYVAGSLPPAMQTAAAIHRLMSSSGGEAAELWEVTRDILDEARDISMDDVDRRNGIAEALDIIQTDFETVRWRRGLTGVRYARPRSGAGQLMHLKPGQSVFAHGHSALEATVVLDGEFEDGIGRYQPGEIVLATPGFKHRPAAAGNTACTCYVAKGDTPFWRFT